MYYKSFTSNDFILQSDGKYKAVILASTHGLDIYYRVSKIVRRDNNSNWENVITSYKILSNGDFVLYADEPGIYEITLVGE